MKRAWCIVVFLAYGCADPSKQSPEARGKGVYAVYNCARCHRIGLEGGDAGPDLTFVGFRKTAEALDVWLKDPGAWQADTLMPNFRFDDGARKDLAAYLATLKGRAWRGKAAPWNAPRLRAQPVLRGEELFLRTGCSACHGIEGKGGYRNNNAKGGIIPDLTKVGEGYSREELMEKIRTGVARAARENPEEPEPLLYMPAWKEVLNDDEIGALAAYLHFLSPPPSDDAEGQW